MRTLVAALCATLLAPHGCAQSDRDLEHYFEGRTVIAKIDMPADGRSLDLSADPRRPLDPAQLRARVTTAGIAVKDGAPVTIQKVTVGRDTVELALGDAVRFILRYENGVPADLTPGAVMAALVDYLEFPFTDRAK